MRGGAAASRTSLGLRPFGIAGIWDRWKHPQTGAVIRTFCIITTKANELVSDSHDRMPVILPA